jgi:hypothetical protein
MMHLQLHLAKYEHLPLQLSRSSCQPLALQQLLALADSPLQQQWQQLELGYPPNIGSLQLRQVGWCTAQQLEQQQNTGYAK